MGCFRPIDVKHRHPPRRPFDTQGECPDTYFPPHRPGALPGVYIGTVIARGLPIDVNLMNTSPDNKVSGHASVILCRLIVPKLRCSQGSYRLDLAAIPGTFLPGGRAKLKPLVLGYSSHYSTKQPIILSRDWVPSSIQRTNFCQINLFNIQHGRSSRQRTRLESRW